MKQDMKTVRGLVENMGNNDKPCQKVIGSLPALYAIADFWERNASSIHLIGTSKLLEYIEDESNKFSHEQIKAYKEGLAEIPLFFQECWEERQEIEEGKLK